MKKIKINSIKSVQDFIKDIDLLVNDFQLDYIDAVVYYCEKNNIEIETAASLVKSSSKIKAKIQLAAEEKNYMTKSAKLPI
jgi:hypothetical protein